MLKLVVVMSDVIEVVDSELVKRDDTLLVARNQMELQAYQTKMALWFREQVLVCKRNEHELWMAVETAKRNKWQASTLQKQLNQSIERKVWLVKCLRAVEAGFAIIPDMPAEVFAIRVFEKATMPRGNSEASLPRFLPDIGCNQLPEGEGKYVSNRPLARQHYDTKKFYSSRLKPVQFPVIAAQTHTNHGSH